MAAHLKKHGIISADDHDMTELKPANTGENGLLGVKSDGAAEKLIVEVKGTTTFGDGYIARRTAGGELLVPETPTLNNSAASKKYVDDEIAKGIWKGNTAQVLADHTTAEAAKCAVGKFVVDTTDKKVYKITAISGTTITFDGGYLPTTPEIRIAEDTDTQWVFDVEGSVWINTGSSSHARLHTMTGTADHSANTWKSFYSDGDGHVQELALAEQNKVFKSAGVAQAPGFDFVKLIELSNTFITCAGATPATTDFPAGSENGTIALMTGSGGQQFIAVKTSGGAVSVELN